MALATNTVISEAELVRLTQLQSGRIAPDEEIAAERETLQDLVDSVRELRGRITSLTEKAGDPSQCRGCGAPIFWFKHKATGKACPYDRDGRTHWATCPNASDFKRARS